jgi:5'-methylthioadenosine phosphorylase
MPYNREKKMAADIQIGMIGGSGLYKMEALKDVSCIPLETPFGRPSDDCIIGTLEGIQVAFLPRHGRKHHLTPSELNYRANIHALKQLGVQYIIAVTAVGSLRKNIKPLDMVIPDQLVDRTRGRISSFFGEGIVAHIPFAEPFCPELGRLIHQAAVEVGASVHPDGALVTIEGPAFSTRSESNIYRQWGLDIIGMTTLQEAKLAREAEICYAAMAMVTDYDCWYAKGQAVNVAAVVEHMQKNIATAKAVIQKLLPTIPVRRDCTCARALDSAIMTDPASIPTETKRRLRLIVGKYL